VLFSFIPTHSSSIASSVPLSHTTAIFKMSIPMATLRSGKQLPLMAFGVGTALYKQDCAQATKQAINAGFTFLDGAEAYANSQYVGQAIKDAGSMEKLIVLDKIGDMKRIYEVAKEELEKLQIDKFDALLLHSPPRGQDGKPSNVEAWKMMERIKDEGLAE
jgi:diketogulonate reductase-like aldo/keto reductase